jgi:hypothetical protein
MLFQKNLLIGKTSKKIRYQKQTNLPGFLPLTLIVIAIIKALICSLK